MPTKPHTVSIRLLMTPVVLGTVIILILLVSIPIVVFVLYVLNNLSGLLVRIACEFAEYSLHHTVVHELCLSSVHHELLFMYVIRMIIEGTS